MPRRDDANSILELLTSPNPEVTHEEPKSKTNSKHQGWFGPKQIKEWKEFKSLDILSRSIVGNLLTEAQKMRTLSFPLLNEAVDCVFHEERDTDRFIYSWNRAIVSEALIPVQQLYNPLVWVKGKNPKTEWRYPRARSLPERTPPPRKCSNENRTPKKRPMRINPDSGSSPYRELSEGDISSLGPGEERFPKEYKPATKWKSKWMIEYDLIDEEGQWEKGKQTDNLSLPILQTYTYCVENMCRYGAILTCEEAFLFRIKPLSLQPGDDPDGKVLKNSLTHNGMMEYTSIPWSNHAGNIQPTEWTVNLALWFMHILAGNNFRAGWDFGREDELRLGTLQANHSSAAIQRQDNNAATPPARRESGSALSSTSRHTEAGDEKAEEYDSDTGPDTPPDDEVPPSSFVESPTQKRKRDDDEINWSFSSKRSSRR